MLKFQGATLLNRDRVEGVKGKVKYILMSESLFFFKYCTCIYYIQSLYILSATFSTLCTLKIRIYIHVKESLWDMNIYFHFSFILNTVLLV